MAAIATLVGKAVTVTPGGEAVSELRIRNSGTFVDRFALEVVGDASAWAVIEPEVVPLIPGAEAVARVKFKPPRSSSVPARAIPFAVRVKSQQEARASLVEEGVVVVGAFHETSADLVPHTAKGSSRARAQLALANRGNVRVNARLTAVDPHRSLTFTITPPGLTAEPGMASIASIRLSPRQLFITGPPKINRYKVHVHQEREPMITVEGSMQQEALIPTWLLLALIGLAAMVLIAVILWLAVLKPGITSAATAAHASALQSLQGQTTAALTFSRQSLTFTQNLGSTSRPESITLVNSGGAPLHLRAISVSGDFVQSNDCPTVLAPGATCAIDVAFVPSTRGDRDGYIELADDSVVSPQRIPVTGVSTMATAHLGTERVNFSQNVGASTAPQTVTLTNRGDGPLNIASVAATGDFKAISHCPSLLPPGLSCSIGVTFTPVAAGARSGSLVVTDDANSTPGSQETVRLTGFAYQPVATLSAAVLSPGANLGAPAEPQVVTVTNTGDGVLTIRAIGIRGAAAGDYTQSNSCLRTIVPRRSCSITVTFTAHGYGLRAAALTLADDGPGGTQSIALRGTGTAPRPSLSSGYLNFGGGSVGRPSLPQNVALSNTGNGQLAIGSVVLTGDDFAMSTNCGNSLAAGASCSISVTFLPQTTGGRSGVVTISDSVGTQKITLSGVGT